MNWLSAAATTVELIAGEVDIDGPLPGNAANCADFKRKVAVLSKLSEAVYDLHTTETREEYQRKMGHSFAAVAPKFGNARTLNLWQLHEERQVLPDSASLSSVCRLLHLHYRGQGEGRVKFAIWQVERLGVVVAFRGTRGIKDMLVNAKLAPVPLVEGQRQGIHVHRGFKQGAAQHAELIAEALRTAAAAGGPGGRTNIILTGHSLGGAYASTLLLHMAAQAEGTYADLFKRGMEVVTFGSPFVAHSEDLHHQVLELPGFRDAQCSVHPWPRISNIVNDTDVVPRLLGDCIPRTVRTLLEVASVAFEDTEQEWIQMLAAVPEISKGYKPLGHYHLIIGGQLRTLNSTADGRAGEDAMKDLKLIVALAEHLRSADSKTQVYERLKAALSQALSQHKCDRYIEELCKFAERGPEPAEPAREPCGEFFAAIQVVSKVSAAIRGFRDFLEDWDASDESSDDESSDSSSCVIT